MTIKTLGAALAAACAGIAGIAQAAPLYSPPTAPGETFKPYVYSNLTYDSNLFRVSGEDEARALNGDSTMDDFVGRLGAGLNITKPISLQTLRFNGWVERVHYHHFDDLDNTAAHALGAWDWEVGRLLDGTVSQSYDRTLSSFEQFHQRTKDLKTVYTTHVDGALHITPDWDWILGGNLRRQNNDERNFLDRKENTLFTELRYFTTVDSHVGLRAATVHGDLEQTTMMDGQAESNDYRENRYSVVVGWAATSISRLQAQLGVTQHRLYDQTGRDFTGVTGRLDYDWFVTPITTLRFSVWRNVSSFDGDIATYVISKGVSVQPSWQATEKISLNLWLAAERDDFDGGNPSTTPDTFTSKREDKLYTARLGISYQPIYPLRLTLAYQAQKRDSNVDNAEFRDNQVVAEVEYAF